MAIGLADLKGSARSKKNSEQAQPQKEKKKALRPWESFDQFANETRTLSAKEAVERAKKRLAMPEAIEGKVKAQDVRPEPGQGQGPAQFQDQEQLRSQAPVGPKQDRPPTPWPTETAQQQHFLANRQRVAPDPEAEAIYQSLLQQVPPNRGLWRFLKDMLLP